MEHYTVEFHIEPGAEQPWGNNLLQHATRPEAIAYAEEGCDPTRVAIGYTLHRHVVVTTRTVTAEAPVWNKPAVPV